MVVAHSLLISLVDLFFQNSDFFLLDLNQVIVEFFFFLDFLGIIHSNWIVILVLHEQLELL